MSLLSQFLCRFIFLFIQEKTALDQNAQRKMVSVYTKFFYIYLSCLFLVIELCCLGEKCGSLLSDNWTLHFSDL